MKLKELQPLLNGSIILKINGERELYDAVSQIPVAYLHYEVLSLDSSKSGILLQLKKQDPPKTLEELGYGFEVGV